MIQVSKELETEIDHLNSYGVDAEWFYHPEGQSAIGVGDGFVWSVDICGGVAATHEAKLGEWCTGVEI